MSKEQIKTIINEWNKNDEFYNLEYPNHKEAFVAFMKEQGISLDPNFIFFRLCSSICL